MLAAEECRDRADECARLADATDDPIQIARYRHLESSWLYMFRLKVRAQLQGHFETLARNSQHPRVPVASP
jgi:hypothetical protein